MNIRFDSINVAVGSGGTYAGLWYGNNVHNEQTKVIGYAVDQSAPAFTDKVKEIIHDIDKSVTSFDSININDHYIGLGYGQATDEELAFYVEIAQQEGLFLILLILVKPFVV